MGEDLLRKTHPDVASASVEVAEGILETGLFPMVTYREFVPGMSLLLPDEVAASSESTHLSPVYEKIVLDCREAFESFADQYLGLTPNGDSSTLARKVKDFLREGEELLSRKLLGGNLEELHGARQVAEAVFNNLSPQPVFSLRPEAAAQILRLCPPTKLMNRLGYDTVDNLLEAWAPQDALALAGRSEGPGYLEEVWRWLGDQGRPQHFAEGEMKPLIVRWEELAVLEAPRQAGALDRLAGREMFCSLPPSQRGEFPLLWCLARIGKHVVESERLGSVWRRFAQSKEGFGRRVLNSLVGPGEESLFSARNFWEEGHWRALANRLRAMAVKLRHGDLGADTADQFQLASFLEGIAASYHLVQTMSDGGVVPCSAWTWANYSFNGGKGVPPSCCLQVERDWLGRELLERVGLARGRDVLSLEDTAVEFMAESRESGGLAEELLGEPLPENLVLDQDIPAIQARAGQLARPSCGPILRPVGEHWWESKYVLNAGSLEMEGTVYLFYRAVGEDDVSRIGLAISKNGLDFKERLPLPVFVPQGTSETKGCEDPRVVLIDDQIYMLYTAFDGVTAQIALASIGVQDFQERRWEAWRRHGLAFPGIWNKDALLFPQRFNGKYAMYHRKAPSVWLTYADKLDCPWSQQNHRIVIGPRSGFMWDAAKIGAGSPPLRTRYGWLMIYHGVDYSRVYRLGVLLVAMDDPGRVLYRSPNPVLEPEKGFELGRPGKSWVPNVVFTCGAVARSSKEILDDDDEILVYYGGADTEIGVAIGRIGHLLPPEVRVNQAC